MSKTDSVSIAIPKIIIPDWPAPEHVKAFSTTRFGGVSHGAYESNNLALHVGDNEPDVLKNRALLEANFNLSSTPFWLNQTHTTTVVEVGDKERGADASVSRKVGDVCAVMTADCLPILLCDAQGEQVAAIHAGWRGLLNGIIENTLQCFSVDGRDIIAWLGPAIGPAAFEVGDEVKDFFVRRDSAALNAFQPQTENKWLANIYELAKLRLKKAGVESIFGGEFCTFHDVINDTSLFYSYRRDNVCGRMATLVWLDK